MNVYCRDLLQLDLEPAKFLGNLATAVANQSAGNVIQNTLIVKLVET